MGPATCRCLLPSSSSPHRLSPTTNELPLRIHDSRHACCADAQCGEQMEIRERVPAGWSGRDGQGTPRVVQAGIQAADRLLKQIVDRPWSVHEWEACLRGVVIDEADYEVSQENVPSTSYLQPIHHVEEAIEADDDCDGFSSSDEEEPLVEEEEAIQFIWNNMDFTRPASKDDDALSSIHSDSSKSSYDSLRFPSEGASSSRSASPALSSASGFERSPSKAAAAPALPVAPMTVCLPSSISGKRKACSDEENADDSNPKKRAKRTGDAITAPVTTPRASPAPKSSASATPSVHLRCFVPTCTVTFLPSTPFDTMKEHCELEHRTFKSDTKVLKPYRCAHSYCSQVTGSLGDMDRHLQSLAHTPPKHQCKDCMTTFTRPDALRRHHLNKSACKRIKKSNSLW